MPLKNAYETGRVGERAVLSLIRVSEKEMSGKQRGLGLGSGLG